MDQALECGDRAASSPSEPTTPPPDRAALPAAEVRSNRRALAALLAITLLAAVAAGIGLVARIVDDDAGRPRRDAVQTLDDGSRPIEEEDGNDGIGAVAVLTVAVLAGACVAAPFLIARQRRRRLEPSTEPPGTRG